MPGEEDSKMHLCPPAPTGVFCMWSFIMLFVWICICIQGKNYFLSLVSHMLQNICVYLAIKMWTNRRIKMANTLKYFLRFSLLEEGFSSNSNTLLIMRRFSSAVWMWMHTLPCCVTGTISPKKYKWYVVCVYA